MVQADTIFTRLGHVAFSHPSPATLADCNSSPYLDAWVRLRVSAQRNGALVGVGEALEVSLELTDGVGVRVVLRLARRGVREIEQEARKKTRAAVVNATELPGIGQRKHKQCRVRCTTGSGQAVCDGCTSVVSVCS